MRHLAPSRNSLLIVSALLVACTGSVEDGRSSGTPAGGGRGGSVGVGGTGGGPVGVGGTGVGTPAASAFTCKPSDAPAASPMRRLGSTAYRNTLRDVTALALGGDYVAANEILTALGPELGRLPGDERKKLPQDLHGSYRRLDQDVEQAHVDVFYDVATRTAAELTTPTRLPKLLGVCATDNDPANDRSCLQSFVRRLGERALRRPLTGDEETFYTRFADANAPLSPKGVADLIAAFLTAPQFLYLIEHGDAAVAGKPGVFTLTPYELASRLSYHLWDRMPDPTLFEAARSGALMTPEGFARQVDRLLADERARAVVDDFYRDWWELDALSPLDARATDPVFKAFAGADLIPKLSSLRTQMTDDVVGMARHFTWNGGSVADLLTTPLSFARGAELARIYGVPAWDGTSAPPSFPDGVRPGLLTRAAFLSTGSANTRPVMKGVFVRETILCDSLPAPPDNAMASPPELDPTLTTRQVVERLTEAPGTSCAACHTTLINPIGFATENFDAMGRLRTEQRLFDGTGKEVGRVPIDTRSVPRIDPSDNTVSKGAGDLARLIVESGKAHACLARQYFRFTWGRWETDADGCQLQQMADALRGQGLRDMIRATVMAPAFKERSFR